MSLSCARISIFRESRLDCHSVSEILSWDTVGMDQECGWIINWILDRKKGNVWIRKILSGMILNVLNINQLLDYH